MPRYRTGAIMCKYRFFYNNTPFILLNTVVLFVTFVTHMTQRHTISCLSLVKVKTPATVIGKRKTIYPGCLHNISNL